MQGIIRALARLFVMGAVMTVVLVAAVIAGLGTTTAIAIGIVLAGVVGLVGVARRPPRQTAAQEIAAMMAPAPPAPPPVTRAEATAVEAMAPPATAKDVDPEANMPRWRRPSLLEARRSDPTRQAPVYRLPMRFAENLDPSVDVRVIRYAVVPVLDRPDEVLGHRVSDLEAGDEVAVVAASGTFLEVRCPNGDHGWVHRTTVGQPAVQPVAYQPPTQEADEALNALLSARGMI